jgi:hypothetical protein
LHCRPTRSWQGGHVNLNNPPVRCGGDGQRDARPQGRLHFLQVVPARVQDSATRRRIPPTGPGSCARSGFDVTKFNHRRRLNGCRRSSATCAAAWTGVYPDRPTFRSAWRPQPGRAARLLPDLRAVEWDDPCRAARRQRVTAAADLCVLAFLCAGRCRELFSSHDANSASTAATR